MHQSGLITSNCCVPRLWSLFHLDRGSWQSLNRSMTVRSILCRTWPMQTRWRGHSTCLTSLQLVTVSTVSHLSHASLELAVGFIFITHHIRHHTDRLWLKSWLVGGYFIIIILFVKRSIFRIFVTQSRIKYIETYIFKIFIISCNLHIKTEC